RAEIRRAAGGTRRRARARLRRPRHRRSDRHRARARRPRRVSVDFTTVQLTNVSRHFGRRRALAGLTLSAHAGDVVGLLGPNGAGKSTLIGLMATLVVPSTGRVEFGGRQAHELGTDLRARIGLLAHELHLYSELSARENLIFFARLYGDRSPQAS